MSDKTSLRKEILAKRDSIPPAAKKTKDRAIEERLFLLPEFITAKTIFFFASFRSEVDTFGMLGRALDERKRIVLPRVEGQGLGLYEIKSLDELAPGYMKIPEPKPHFANSRPDGADKGGQGGFYDMRRVSINDVDAVIVPGAAFDETGNRIGYGGGFYDRLLAELQKPVPVIAPTYEEQVIEAVPTDSHDRKVNIIITDRREIRCL
ncbi:MAG: 5-formyltetrahydrofolate cyclo-ligase [Nitrospirae bacterium]|nr:5-formyltetrahydrofolate cyclo-ligase [Nitrospirota bacterium]